MTKKKIVALLLCVVLLLPVAGCAKKAAPIEFPVEEFAWGMTLEEAQKIVDAAGVTPSVREDSDYISWRFKTEDMEKLGMKNILGLPFCDLYNEPVRMNFLITDDGEARLAFLHADILTTGDAAGMTELLTEQYGEVPEGRKLWGTYGVTLTEKQCENLSPVALSIVEREEFDSGIVYPTVDFSFISAREGTIARLYYSGAYYTEFLYGT